MPLTTWKNWPSDLNQTSDANRQSVRKTSSAQRSITIGSRPGDKAAGVGIGSSGTMSFYNVIYRTGMPPIMSPMVTSSRGTQSGTRPVMPDTSVRAKAIR